MKRLFDSLFRRLPAPTAHPPSTPVRHGDLIHPDTSAYLPVAPAQLLSLFSGHIAAIRQTFPSLEEFNGVPARLIADLANYLHLLPASFSHHHRDPGGAFRHALEVGCYAARSAKPLTITPHIGGRRRYDEEAQKCTVAFLLGALHDIGKPFNDFHVRSSNMPDVRWAPNQRSLYEWACEFAPSGYIVERVADYNYRQHRCNLPVDSTLLASRHLATLKPIAYNMYRDALLNSDHPLWKAVEAADRISCVRSTALPSAAQSFLPQLACDAIHHLISSESDWTPNTFKSHIHLTASFIYVSTPEGINQLHCQMLKMDKRSPRQMNSLLDTLMTLGCAYVSPRNTLSHTFFLNNSDVTKESSFICLAANVAPDLYERFGGTNALAEMPNKAVTAPAQQVANSTSSTPTPEPASESNSIKAPDFVNSQGEVGTNPPITTEPTIVANGKLPVKTTKSATKSMKRPPPTPIEHIIDDCERGLLKVGPIGPSTIDIVDGSLRMTVQNALRYFPALPDTSRTDMFLKAYAVPHDKDGYIWPDDTIRLSTIPTLTILEKVNRSQSNG